MLLVAGIREGDRSMAGHERGFLLGAWQVEPSRSLLIARAGGREVHLEPRLMELLLLFAGEPEAVLAKDRIVAAVWGKRAVGDDTLAAAVSRLRSALGESKTERYIETVPKRGYRLLKRPEGASAAPVRKRGKSAELVAKGYAAMKTPLPSALAQARLYFEGAIEADGGADAHCGLAHVFIAQHFAGHGRDLIAAAKAAAQAALALDVDHAP